MIFECRAKGRRTTKTSKMSEKYENYLQKFIISTCQAFFGNRYVHSWVL